MIGWHTSPAPPNHPGNIGGEIVPDEFGTEPLLGYRGWQVVDAGDGSGLALKSLHVPYLWQRENQAFCHRPASLFINGSHRGPISPDPGCSCGIYAQLPEHPLVDWERVKQGTVSASGSIAMWGRIIQCEKGYKAQYAAIQEPVVLDVSCQDGCESSPTRIALPELSRTAYTAFCDQHRYVAHHRVTVQADMWLYQACRQLTGRYGIDVLSWLGR